jgi:hypothetical protein
MFVALSPGASAIRVPYNLAPEEQIFYYRVEESTSGRGKTIYDFKNASMYASSSSGDFTATLTRIARPNLGGGSCSYLGDSRGGLYTYPYAPNTNYDFERGLPQVISQYTSAGKLVSRKTTTFQRTTLTTDVTYGIRFEYNNNSYQYQKYPILANADNVTATESERLYEFGAASDSSTNYVETISTYSYNTGQLLHKVKVTKSGAGTDTTTIAQTIKYAKDYATTGTDTQGSLIAQLVSTNRHATPIETVSFNGATVTGAALTLFSNFGGSIAKPSQQLVFSDTTGFTQSTVSGSAFTYASTRYLPAVTFDAYDSVGHPTISHNLSKVSSSVMMGYRASAPALEIANGRVDQLAYSDFEPYLATGITSSLALSNSDSWSGQYSAPMTSSSNISQTGITKAAGSYRFSAWVKSSAAATFTITSKVSGSTTSTDTVKFPTASAGKWKYVEKSLALSSVTTNASFDFVLTLTSGSSASVDNLAFYPASATIAAHAYDPLNGKTADLDARGNAGFMDYDTQGRQYRVRNVDKDVVSITDYHYKAGASPLPLSHFVPSNETPAAGTSVTYTADASCMGGVTYAWYVDGVVQSSTSNVMTYSFPVNVNKDYRIKLIASSNYGSTATESIVHPTNVLSITISKGSGESGAFDCHDSGVRTLTVNLTGCYDSANTTYEWYYTYGTPTSLKHPLGTTTSGSLTYNLLNSANNYVYCIIHTTCTNQTTGAPEPYPVSVVITNYITFTLQSGSGC